MEDFRLLIQEEIRRLRTLLASLPSIDKRPSGQIVRYEKKAGPSFYLRLNAENSFKALGGKDSEAVKASKSAFYAYELRRRILHNAQVLERALRRLQPCDREAIVAALPVSLRDVPLVPPEPAEEVISMNDLAKWARADYSRLVEDFSRAHYTLLGRKMRSKSEVIIANALDAYGIPYRSDARISLLGSDGNYYYRYPDFMIKTPSGKLLYWEHFGMLGNEEYAEGAGGKFHLYAINGIVPGDNLILSADCADGSLDARWVNALIVSRVLPHFR